MPTEKRKTEKRGGSHMARRNYNEYRKDFTPHCTKDKEILSECCFLPTP